MERRRRDRGRDKDKDKDKDRGKDHDRARSSTVLNRQASKVDVQALPLSLKNWGDSTETWNKLIVALHESESVEKQVDIIALFIGINDHHVELKSSIILDYHFLNIHFMLEHGFDGERVAFLFGVSRRLLELCSGTSIEFGATPPSPVPQPQSPRQQSIKEQKQPASLEETFSQFKSEILSVSGPSNEPNKLFSLENARIIVDYFAGTFFRHQRLWKIVVRDDQEVDQRSTGLEVLVPAPPLPLSIALTSEQVREREERERKAKEALEQQRRVKERAEQLARQAQEEADRLVREQRAEIMIAEYESESDGTQETEIEEEEAEVVPDHPSVPPEVLVKVAEAVARDPLETFKSEMDSVFSQHRAILTERLSRVESQMKR